MEDRPEERTVAAVAVKYGLSKKRTREIFMQVKGLRDKNFEEPVDQQWYDMVCDDIEHLPSVIRRRFKVI